MPAEQNFLQKELSAEIRNKLQACKIVLESFKEGKSIPSALINIALNDLENILKLIENREVVMSKRKYRTWDEIELVYYTKHPKELKGYLTVALEEYQKDYDEKAFLYALSFATRVHGGSSKLSKAKRLNRENLYRDISNCSVPRLSTLMRVMSTLGFSLIIS